MILLSWASDLAQTTAMSGVHGRKRSHKNGSASTNFCALPRRVPGRCCNSAGQSHCGCSTDGPQRWVRIRDRERDRERERERDHEREGTEARRPSRERERDHERERFEMVARAAEMLEEAGLADLSRAVRQQLERMHRRGDGERREGREHQERERAEGRPVTLGHLREMREFIGQLHERVEDLSNRVEELEGVLEEAEEREGGEEREREGDSP